MKRIYRDCTMECFREDGMLYCSIFYNPSGYEINSFYSEEPSTVRIYMESLMDIVDDWYEEGMVQDE